MLEDGVREKKESAFAFLEEMKPEEWDEKRRSAMEMLRGKV